MFLKYYIHSQLPRSFYIKSYSTCSFRIKNKFGRYNVITTVGKVSTRKTVPLSICKPEYWETGIPAQPPPSPQVHSPHHVDLIHSACQLASCVLQQLAAFIQVGVTTDEIDKLAHEIILSNNAYPSPLNYKGFPKSVCTSVNNVACHGIPDDRKLLDGDIINVDVTVYKGGVHGDASRMYHVGNVDSEGLRLSQVCQEALDAAILSCAPQQPFSIIGETIENFADEKNLTVIPCFTGHGIGSYFHGPPDIYHISNNYPGVMKSGMIFTIEPVLGQGSEEIEVQEDGWTAVTIDCSRTAQWEHTVLITDSGAVPLTGS